MRLQLSVHCGIQRISQAPAARQSASQVPKTCSPCQQNAPVQRALTGSLHASAECIRDACPPMRCLVADPCRRRNRRSRAAERQLRTLGPGPYVERPAILSQDCCSVCAVLYRHECWPGCQGVSYLYIPRWQRTYGTGHDARRRT